MYIYYFSATSSGSRSRSRSLIFFLELRVSLLLFFSRYLLYITLQDKVGFIASFPITVPVRCVFFLLVLLTSMLRRAKRRLRVFASSSRLCKKKKVCDQFRARLSFLYFFLKAGLTLSPGKALGNRNLCACRPCP